MNFVNTNIITNDFIFGSKKVVIELKVNFNNNKVLVKVLTKLGTIKVTLLMYVFYERLRVLTA